MNELFVTKELEGERFSALFFRMKVFRRRTEKPQKKIDLWQITCYINRCLKKRASFEILFLKSVDECQIRW